LGRSSPKIGLDVCFYGGCYLIWRLSQRRRDERREEREEKNREKKI